MKLHKPNHAAQRPNKDVLSRGLDSGVGIQRKENRTGMPDHLKSGIENLSGMDMGDVKVHYNSSKPAGLQAHAYAQGRDIHLAPGQERHLPHEAWHVVQQKQGRVKPTVQMKGKISVNDDDGLEKEADAMGNKALGKQSQNKVPMLRQGITSNGMPAQRYTISETAPKGQVSEDKEVLRLNGGSLYATAPKLVESNKKLAATGPFGSMIRLDKLGEAKVAFEKSFYKVIPAISISAYHRRVDAMPKSFHKGINKQDEEINIWADCRRASELVSGASSALGRNDRQVKVGGNLENAYVGGIDRPSKVANDNSTARLSFSVYTSYIHKFLAEYGLKALDKNALLKNFPEMADVESGQMKKWIDGVILRSKDDISVAERLYDSLVAGGANKFHKDTGTNQYANPEIGDSYATVTEYGMPDFEGSGDDWSFHWGGVVMKGGSDNITLENLSVSDEKAKNNNWFFAMYGTEKKGQSFHERQMATGHHGNKATTLVAVTELSTENRKLEVLKNKVEQCRQDERMLGVDQRVAILKATVEYNKLAISINKEPLTEYEVLGHDRKFTDEDLDTVHDLNKKYIPQ